MRREQSLLEYIVAAANAIREFSAGYSSESFQASELVRSAVVHQLTVIGEATAQLPRELRDRHREIRWTDIKGLRNIVVHSYFGIDWAQIWNIATLEVPLLREQVIEILNSLS